MKNNYPSPFPSFKNTKEIKSRLIFGWNQVLSVQNLYLNFDRGTKS